MMFVSFDVRKRGVATMVWPSFLGGIALLIAGCGPGDRLIPGRWVNLSQEPVELFLRVLEPDVPVRLKPGQVSGLRAFRPVDVDDAKIIITYVSSGKRIEGREADFLMCEPYQERSCLYVIPSYEAWRAGARPGALGPYKDRWKPEERENP